MVYLHDFEITDLRLVSKLKWNFRDAFEKVSKDHYIFKGFWQPLLAVVEDGSGSVASLYDHDGLYTYRGQNKITLRGYGNKYYTYRKIIIFGVPFMVCTSLSDEDAALAAMTSRMFVESLIDALPPVTYTKNYLDK